MTGSASREPTRWRRCGRRCTCSPGSRTRAPASQRPRGQGSRPVHPAPVPGPTLPRPPRERSPARSRSRQDLYQDAEQRGVRIAERLQARALAERGSRLSPDELATALEASTSLPAEVIARLARARSEENIAARAERARAADLDHAAASHSARQHANGLTAAGRDTMIADTAGAHAARTGPQPSSQPRASPARPRTVSGPPSTAGSSSQPRRRPARRPSRPPSVPREHAGVGPRRSR